MTADTARTITNVANNKDKIDEKRREYIDNKITSQAGLGYNCCGFDNLSEIEQKYLRENGFVLTVMGTGQKVLARW